MFQKSPWFLGVLHFESVEELIENLQLAFKTATQITCDDDDILDPIQAFFDPLTYSALMGGLFGIAFEIETKDYEEGAPYYEDSYVYIQKNY